MKTPAPNPETTPPSVPASPCEAGTALHFLRTPGLLLLASALFLTGCSGNWLVGKWTLDKERTLEELERSAAVREEAGPAEGLVTEILGGLRTGLSRVLLTQFEGVQVEFTSEEIRRTKAGTGSAQAYEIIERPTRNLYLVQYDDGSIVTWGKVEKGLRMKLPGEGETWVYFRPASAQK